MHLKRWITAIAALPLLILLIYYGGPIVFAAAIGGVSVLALREYFHISFAKQKKQPNKVITSAAYLAGAVMMIAAYHNRLDLLFMVMVVNLLICGCFGLFIFKNEPAFPDTVNRQVTGLLYIPGLLSFLILIRNEPQGVTWIFFLLCLVSAGDTAAFYTGTYLGKHKICPSVSPKKTVEGSLGGLFANAAVGVVFSLFFLTTLPLLSCMAFSVAVGIAGQVGDLYESTLKRAADIKDSGTLLPGHGGMLDRIDALIFATPLAYLLMGVIF